jgi:nucleotide-binding universal stress UspA family protein
MIDKILWASDGSKDSIQTLRYAEILAKKFKTEILGLYVIPDCFERIVGKFPLDEKDKLIEWIEEIESKERERVEDIARNFLEDIARDFNEKGITFRIEIGRGIPHKEILRIAYKEKADLIALGRGIPTEKSILGGTVLKVLRRSSLPILTAREGGKSLDIRRILIPMDISHEVSKSLKYAVELSKEFSATIYLLNIVEVGNCNFSVELIEQIRELSFRKIEENITRLKIKESIETCVEVARNAWMGIVKFANERGIDLIVMMTYGGKRIKEDFIGSVAEKVIQEASCPVITMKP